jgi:molecular chaperone GrpE
VTSPEEKARSAGHGRPEADSPGRDAGPDAPRGISVADDTAETSFGDAEAPPAGASAAADEEPQAPGDEQPQATGDEQPQALGDEQPQDEETVSQDLDELTAKARERDEYLALAQRTQADFENYRKRMARENAQAAERGVTKVAKELLPALDHLELALNAADGHEDVVKGFAMVRDELAAALERVGVQAFSPQGEAFDPNEHEAMAQRPAEEGVEPGTVVEVYGRGWRVNGAVLRPARVVVAQ